jgi:hypothetical protein
MPILLTDEVVPPPALIRAGFDSLPSIIRVQGERAIRPFMAFFIANIRNRNIRMGLRALGKAVFFGCPKGSMSPSLDLALFAPSTVSPGCRMSSGGGCRLHRRPRGKLLRWSTWKRVRSVRYHP